MEVPNENQTRLCRFCACVYSSVCSNALRSGDPYSGRLRSSAFSRLFQPEHREHRYAFRVRSLHRSAQHHPHRGRGALLAGIPTASSIYRSNSRRLHRYSIRRRQRRFGRYLTSLYLSSRQRCRGYLGSPQAVS